jgi:biopolymer transport protein ExbD
VHGSGNDGSPNLTPLLDLVLQLIMFLLLTANFVSAKAFNRSIQLPVIQKAEPLNPGSDYVLYLNVDKDGDILITESKDTNKINAANEAHLKAYLEGQKIEKESEAAAKGKHDPEITVVLRADQDAKYGDLYRILDACKRAKYSKFHWRAMTKAK